jgi:glucose/arabinose dehydrogenase
MFIPWRLVVCLSVAAWVTLVAEAVRAQPTLSDSTLLVESVVTGLSLPTTMDFVGANDILVLQKNDGRVRRVLNGVIQSTVALDVAVNNSSERGLLGIAVNTESPPGVFLFYTEVADPDGNGVPDSGTPLGNRVYRYTWNQSTGQLESPQLIVDLPWFPGANHDGGILALGPTPTPGAGQSLAGDGSALHVIIGDLNRNGQLENFPSGAAPDDTAVILRIQQDGSAYPGNPFVPYCSTTTSQTCPSGSGCPGGETCVTNVSRYFAYGIRNSFGMAVDPATGNLWDTENGPSTYDEVNFVPPGFNSGWEQIMGPDSRDPQGVGDLFDMPGAGSTYSDPEFSWLDTNAPTAIVLPVGSALGSSYDSVALVADNNLGQIYRFPLNAQRDAFDLGSFTGLSDLVADSSSERNALRIGRGFGRVTDLKIGPDGALYVVSIFDGAIYRIRQNSTPTSTATPTHGHRWRRRRKHRRARRRGRPPPG